MRTLAVAVIFFALLASAAFGAPPSLAQPSLLHAPKLDLAGHMAMLLDPDQNLTLAEVANPANAARFVPLPGNLNQGYSSSAVWLRFTLLRNSDSSKQWWLEVQPAALDYLDLYVPNADGSYGVRHSGDSLPFSRREIAYQNPVFRLDMPLDQPQTFYLRIAGKNPLSARLTAWTPMSFATAIGDERLLYGLLFGIHIAMILASLWFWQATRDKTYAYFAGFTLAGMVGTAASAGLLAEYMLQNLPYWHDPAIGFSLIFSLCFGLQFIMHFIEASRYFPRLVVISSRILWAFGLLATVAIGLGYFKVLMPVLQIVVSVFSSMILLLTLMLVLHGHPRARYVLLGLALLSGSALVRMLQTFGYMPLNVVTENSNRICMLLFLLLMNYAISRRYQELRREKEAAQYALLMAARDSEQQLESLVALRTGDLQQAMRQVEHALVLERLVQQQQRQFLATVSHEIRTPLAVIDAAAQNLERELQGAALTIKARVEKIQQATSRLSSLFDDYASDVHFEGLSHGINLQWTPLEPMLQDAAAAGRLLADGHVFQIDPATQCMTVCCDPDLMRLILRTLADNAVKYTLPGTRIVFSGEVNENGCTVNVHDDGPGIRPEDQQRVFEKYFRGEAATRGPGTGLGLAFGRRLAEMQGGTLSLISAPGHGSTFRIWLPRMGSACIAADADVVQSSADAGPKNS